MESTTEPETALSLITFGSLSGGQKIVNNWVGLELEKDNQSRGEMKKLRVLVRI